MFGKRLIAATVIPIITCFLVACEPSNDKQSNDKNTQDKLPAEAPQKALKSPATIETDIGHLSSDEANQTMRAATPEIAAYQTLLSAALTRPVPVLKLSDLPTDQQPDQTALEAESIALAHQPFRKFTHHQQNHQALRNEIMLSRKALPGDFRKNEANACLKANCYRVDMYNYFYNLTSTAIVDLNAKRVLSIDHLANTQPDLNPRLKQLARAIADNSPDVKTRLGDAHTGLSPTMAEIKTARKGSRCERSKHLCVAPTYVTGERALWAIVDLTELDLVGLRWSELGTTGPPVIVTERTLENRLVFNEYCEKVNQFKQGAWTFDYNITSSDGMQLTEVSYNNHTVINSVKLVDWHVSYSREDNFGYSDAIGCPLFSSAVVVAHNGPSQEPIMENGEQIGFAFIQDFRQLPWPTPCNYRYEQRFEFYQDGRFRIAHADYGRGCGTDGTYRPVSRIDLAKPDNTALKIAHFADNAWQKWEKERWTLQDDLQLFEDKYTHRIADDSGKGYYLAPGNGQFNDGGRGDHAYVYATVNHPEQDEGERDLSTLGSCCNQDHQQGPELFMQPAESLANQDWVLWYVAQIKNDGESGQEYCWADTQVVDGAPKIKVWPCFAGPMFVPIEL